MEALPSIGPGDFPPGGLAGADAPQDEATCNEQSTIDGPRGIHVLVRWCAGTGQYHVAKELVITTRGGTLRLESQAPTGVPEDDEDDPMYPLIEQIVAAGPDRWVALGWTSHGEGLQTEHAWLIDDRRGPRIIDSLAWTTDRRHAGFAVDTTWASSQVRIGIPLPDVSARAAGAAGDDVDDDRDHALHNEGDWELVHDGQHLALADVRRLPSSEQHVMTLRGYYNPPSQDEPSLRHWSGHFVWFSAGTRFTIVQARR